MINRKERRSTDQEVKENRRSAPRRIKEDRRVRSVPVKEGRRVYARRMADIEALGDQAKVEHLNRNNTNYDFDIKIDYYNETIVLKATVVVLCLIIVFLSISQI